MNKAELIEFTEELQEQLAEVANTQDLIFEMLRELLDEMKRKNDCDMK